MACENPRAMDRAKIFHRLAFSAVVLLALVLAGIVRVAALRQDFWLDEIWSLEWAQRAGSWWGVLSDDGMQHDNNHPANTWFLKLMGPGIDFWWYRALSFGAGLVAVGVAVFQVGRRGLGSAVAAGMVFALAFLGVVYSTEARGYGPLMAAVMLGYASLRHSLERGGMAGALGFWCSAALGIVSHLTFLHFWFGAFCGHSLPRCASKSPRNARGGAVSCGFTAVPLLCFVLYYAVFVRRMEIGGGPPFEWSLLLTDTVAWGIGGPRRFDFAVVLGVIVLGLVVVDGWALRRRGDREWMLVPGVLIAPVLTVTLLRPELLFPRYFLVCLLFLHLVLARFLGRLLDGGLAGGILASVLLVGYVAGNALHLVPFLEHGRGQYREALRYLVDHTPGAVVRVTSDQDFRNERVLDYFARFLPKGRRVEYWSATRPAPGPIPWLIVHRLEEGGSSEPMHTLHGNVYVLEAEFPHSGPSGFSWSIYRSLASR